MKKCLIPLLGLLFVTVNAQDREYELEDPAPMPVSVWNTVKANTFGWGSIDERYQRNAVPKLGHAIKLYAWRGERVGAQAVLLAPRAIKKLRVEVADLKCGKNIIPASVVKKYFVCYSLADAYKNREGKVEHVHINHEKFDSSLVADRLSPVEEMSVPLQTLRPVWLDIRIPQSAAPGKYV